MKIPEWTKPGLTGAVVGAIALAIVGFSWGGWMTGGSVAEMSSKESAAATVAALTPYCVQRSLDDPMAADVLAEIGEASAFQRRSIIEKAGWATPLGADKPVRALAVACGEALANAT